MKKLSILSLCVCLPLGCIESVTSEMEQDTHIDSQLERQEADMTRFQTIIIAPGDGDSFDEYGEISFSAEFDGIDVENVTRIEWFSDIQGRFLDGNGGSYTDLLPGEHEISVQGISDEGYISIDTVNISIADQDDAPSISITYQDDGVIEAGTLFEIGAVVSDDQDSSSQLSVRVRSSLDGELCSGAASSSGNFSCDISLEEGEHELELQVVDSDNYRASASTQILVLSDIYVDQDGDGFSPAAGDCDDSDPEINPNASEVCDGIDNDCQHGIDTYAIDGTLWYLDADSDGYGVEDSVIKSCTQPAGYAFNQGDCDDSEAGSWPGNPEVCDGVDNDCNGLVDIDDSGVIDSFGMYNDVDGDGYGNPSTVIMTCEPIGGMVENGDDCYDSNVLAFPGQTEYFPSDRGDGSFDYDCDNQETIEYPVTATNNGIGLTIGSSCYRSGWTYSVNTQCGYWAQYKYCSGGQVTSIDNIPQTCRQYKDHVVLLDK